MASNNKLIIHGTDLASRVTAATQRSILLSLIRKGQKITIDFPEIESLAESYADELFGVLVIHYGLEWLLDHVIIKTKNQYALQTIATAIARRQREAQKQKAA